MPPEAIFIFPGDGESHEDSSWGAGRSGLCLLKTSAGSSGVERGLGRGGQEGIWREAWTEVREEG